VNSCLGQGAWSRDPTWSFARRSLHVESYSYVLCDLWHIIKSNIL